MVRLISFHFVSSRYIPILLYKVSLVIENFFFAKQKCATHGQKLRRTSQNKGSVLRNQNNSRQIIMFISLLHICLDPSLFNTLQTHGMLTHLSHYTQCTGMSDVFKVQKYTSDFNQTCAKLKLTYDFTKNNPYVAIK